MDMRRLPRIPVENRCAVARFLLWVNEIRRKVLLLFWGSYGLECDRHHHWLVGAGTWRTDRLAVRQPGGRRRSSDRQLTAPPARRSDQGTGYEPRRRDQAG